MVLVFFALFLVVYHGFYAGFELLTTKTAVNTKKNHECRSFPSIASVGSATNPHNLSLYGSSTQLEMLLALSEPQ